MLECVSSFAASLIDGLIAVNLFRAHTQGQSEVGCSAAGVYATVDIVT